MTGSSPPPYILATSRTAHHSSRPSVKSHQCEQGNSNNLALFTRAHDEASGNTSSGAGRTRGGLHIVGEVPVVRDRVCEVDCQDDKENQLNDGEQLHVTNNEVGEQRQELRPVARADARVRLVNIYQLSIVTASGAAGDAPRHR